jgi:hypothetical protein
MHYPIICLEETMKTLKNLSQDNWRHGRDSTRRSTECKWGELQLEPIWSGLQSERPNLSISILLRIASSVRNIILTEIIMNPIPAIT